MSFIDKWYPIHIPCLDLCIHFDCCKCTDIWMGINHKNGTLSRLYKAIKSICYPFGPFNRPKWQISLPFHILQRVKSLPLSYTWSLKKVPLWAEPPRIGHYREYLLREPRHPARWLINPRLLSVETHVLHGDHCMQTAFYKNKKA